ncbi:MAG: hypothetical protein CTY30_00875 [Methylocystis sp.]|nr:MAG: hypothetical protein CTY30_00875 [Methylocystis sp.]
MKTSQFGFGPRMPLRTIAMDAAPAGLARKSTAPASAPARKPTTPPKPAADAPSREESLQGLLAFLAEHLPDEVYQRVEEELRRSVLGSSEEASYRPAADRRPKIAGDSASDGSFFSRFPSARRIGAV